MWINELGAAIAGTTVPTALHTSLLQLLQHHLPGLNGPWSGLTAQRRPTHYHGVSHFSRTAQSLAAC
jgi:hypothetical protein